MKLKTYVVGNEEKKITTYQFEIYKKNIMFDCGSERLKESDISNVDFLFISHEHLDHWYSLYILITKFKDDCKIYATETTKMIMLEIVKKELDRNGANDLIQKTVIEAFKKINSLIFFKEYCLDDNINVILYPSGHTFGSSMVYLKTADLKILYTGDMDYVVKKENRKYECPNDLEVDILIVDGTNFLGSDYKTQMINRAAENVKDINHITFNIRTEKAVFLAQHLSEINCLNEHTIIYEGDLKWYLKIISEQGYNAFLMNRIVLENKKKPIDDTKKTIRLSSLRYQKYNRDWSFGLHISKDDVVSFIHQFQTYPKVYFGHYNLENYDEFKASCDEYKFNLLLAGVNEI